MPLDNGQNFSKAITTTLHNAAVTTIALGSGQGANLPDPAVREYNITWHDFTNFPDPSDDPNVEIVRVITKVADVLTVIRGQENIAATDKNTASATYRFLVAPTDKFRTDVQTEIQLENLNYAIATGTGDALVITLDPVVTSYVDGQIFKFKTILKNTTQTPTLDAGGGAKTIVGINTRLYEFELATGKAYTVQYLLASDQMQLISNSYNSFNIFNNDFDFGTDTGVADAYEVISTIGLASGKSNSGAVVRFEALNTNTGASTLSVSNDAATVRPIVKKNGLALVGGDITAGDIVKVVKNGTDWQLMSSGKGVNITGQASATVASGDELLIADVSASNNPKKVTAGAIASLPTTPSNFVSAYDTTTQTVSIANTFQDITFNTNVELDGWTHTGGTADFVCPETAKYLVEYTINSTKTTGSNSLIEVISLFNGTEIAGSQIGSFSTVNNSNQSASGEIIISGVATQILKFQLTGATVNSTLAPPGGNATTSPSMTVSITRL